MTLESSKSARIQRARTRLKSRVAKLRQALAKHEAELKQLQDTPGPFIAVPAWDAAPSEIESASRLSPPPASSPIPREASPASPRPGSSSPVVVVAAAGRSRSSSRRGETVVSAVARAEAAITTRVQVLQAEGKWAGSKKWKAVVEPPVMKTHWGYVLEEMTWMSSVVQQELKMRKTLSRKCARMVQKHFQDRHLAVARAQKATETNKRKIASFMAKEIRGFWANIQKLFEYQLKTQIEEKRKEALDVHLNFIVDKTEKFSTLLAESLATTNSTPGASDGESMDGGSSTRSHSRQDREYRPAESSDDDEATISKDDDQREDDELDDLNREADIPVEDLLKKFHPELFADKEEEKSDPNETQEQDAVKAKDKGEKDKTNGNTEEAKGKDNNDEDDEDEEKKKDLKVLVDPEPEEDSDNDEFFGAIEAAAQFKPTGNTLDTTNVKTKVPFLLKHTLREYQHIGLDWLVSLHERQFNGILADEMGLGKTIQTIALLAHLACEKESWGPHLIVVPTSVMLNWEMEIKKWCPAFKILTYYGSQKERKAKRVGWTKPNSFHICITSYKLVIQDHSSFRRKQWHYLILDEAQHIKNFKSQRWQLLLNFSSRARLLLTGTPLQNNLMELWSLMHFLMPNVFQSHRNFKEWFSNPLTGMVEDTAEYNDSLVKRLHKVLRPFLLRRLKNEVEKQMPKKYEHVIKCTLSKRQRFLYDDFMSRSKTQETLATGNFLNVINILMQLRKVCNHPNLFEPRPTVSPFVCDPIITQYLPPKPILKALDYRPLDEIDLKTHSLCLTNNETTLSAFDAFNLHRLKVSDIPTCVRLLAHESNQIYIPPCPRDEFRMRVRPVPLNTRNQREMIQFSNVINNNLFVKGKKELSIKIYKGTYLLVKSPQTPVWPSDPQLGYNLKDIKSVQSPGNGLVSSPLKRPHEASDPLVVPAKTVKTEDGDEKKVEQGPPKTAKGIFSSKLFQGGLKSRRKMVQREYLEVVTQDLKQKFLLNESRCRATPFYGLDLVQAVSNVVKPLEHLNYDLPQTFDRTILERFHIFVPPVLLANKSIPNGVSKTGPLIQELISKEPNQRGINFNLLLPELRLIQYDCGKLQVMAGLLRKLKAENHRVLVFTQMTKMLDVLESFLNYHGFIYLRLDGATKVEQRQALMERFNGDPKYFCFILSTRSGGVGINLTGADTVIFYDSDWNPTMVGLITKFEVAIYQLLNRIFLV